MLGSVTCMSWCVETLRGFENEAFENDAQSLTRDYTSLKMKWTFWKWNKPFLKLKFTFLENEVHISWKMKGTSEMEYTFFKMKDSFRSFISRCSLKTSLLIFHAAACVTWTVVCVAWTLTRKNWFFGRSVKSVQRKNIWRALRQMCVICRSDFLEVYLFFHG